MDRLEMKGICKAFGGVTVLDHVDFSITSGKVHALLGENGAGKSTLMKILTGVYSPDAGAIQLNGQPLAIRQVMDARKIGIEMIHQELSLFTNLSIRENFLIGYEESYKKFGFINYRKLDNDVRSILKLVQLDREPDEPLANLGIGERQLVEIAKALKQNARFLVMDEPTAALTQTETEVLFERVREMAANDVGIIYISHRMEELFQISDQVIVLRDGRVVLDKPTTEATERELITAMVGRSVDQRYPKVEANAEAVVLQVENLSTGVVHSASLEVRAGEVVGIGGLMGAGRTELARAIAGIDKVKGGRMTFLGQPFLPKSPLEAINRGIAYVPEDRKEQGLILPFSVRDNLALPTLDSRSRVGFIQVGAERKFAAELTQRLHIRTASVEATVDSLSGGNQQKVVIAKWLACNPKLLVLDEPTRGVDVGAKQEIYQMINEMKMRGMAVLMISSDLPELLGMSDRVYVMHEGDIQGHLAQAPFEQEEFMYLATGGVKK